MTSLLKSMKPTLERKIGPWYRYNFHKSLRTKTSANVYLKLFNKLMLQEEIAISVFVLTSIPKSYAQ